MAQPHPDASGGHNGIPIQDEVERFAPIGIDNLKLLVEQELDRLRRTVPSDSWGEVHLDGIANILRLAQPARIYIKGIPPGVSCNGGYETTTREDADILLLDEETATTVLAEGPKDGKRVLIRAPHATSPYTPDKLLDDIEEFRMLPIDTQDPYLPKRKASFRLVLPADIVRDFRSVKTGNQVVGYDEGQIPPYNLLSLPSFTSSKPSCLIKTDATQILNRFRVVNGPESFQASERPMWSLLALHMAISLAHQDHDGLGTFIHGICGYKVWIFWPELTPSERAIFLRNGTCFHCGSARFVVLGHGDRYVQTPACSQDVHAVLSLGYCGVSRCNKDCLNRGHPACSGLVAADGMHYWHAHYMADSVRAARDELLYSHITN